MQPDPKKYKRLSKPFKSIDYGRKRANAFLDELEQLREKYGIPELAVTGGVWATDGEERKLVPFRFVAGDKRYTFTLLEGLLNFEAREIADSMKAKVRWEEPDADKA